MMITRILIFSLLYCLPFYDFAQQNYPKQSVLYENLLHYWYIKDLHQDSIQLISLSDKLRVWKEKNSCWLIVPAKSQDTLRCLFMYKNQLKDTLSFVIKPIPCDWIEVSIDMFMLEKRLALQQNISLNEFRRRIEESHIKKDSLSSLETSVYFNFDAQPNIKDMFYKDMRFKPSKILLLIYDTEKKVVKYQKEYQYNIIPLKDGAIREFTFDLLEWLPQMQIGNQLIIRFPHVLRMGYDQKLSVFTCKGSEFIEKVYQIVE